MMKIPWNKRIWALYKGEDFITEGTIEEISKATNKTINHLKFMTYPVYEKRVESRGNNDKCMRMISLDDE